MKTPLIWIILSIRVKFGHKWPAVENIIFSLPNLDNAGFDYNRNTNSTAKKK
jgi:hypothetical protein